MFNQQIWLGPRVCPGFQLSLHRPRSLHRSPLQSTVTSGPGWTTNSGPGKSRAMEIGKKISIVTNHNHIRDQDISYD